MLAPLLGGRTVDVFEMFAETWWGVAGKNFAKHALESALWDAHARTEKVSLRNALGGVRDSVVPGVVVGLAPSVEDTVHEVGSRVAEGYRRIKLKIEPGRDVDVVRAVRAAVGDAIALQVDANAAYSRDDYEQLSKLDEFSLQFIEQPLAADDIEGHALLAGRIHTPVCLDESIENCDQLMRAIEMGACSVVNVKPSRVGGIGDALRMHNIVATHGLDAWVGGMLETGIGRASCLALASLPGFTLTPDLSASNRYFDRDVTAPFELENGEIRVPNTEGIGVQPLPWVFEHPEVEIETLFQV
jgi:O-succinylbenzoate synthase